MITSSQNSKIQLVRGLVARRKDREAEGAYVVEGVRLVEEAFQSGLTPRLVLYTNQLSERGKALLNGFSQRGAEVEEISLQLMESIAGTEAPQGILAVLPLTTDFEHGFHGLEPVDFIVVLDGIRDPGNLGTILRSAAAAGAQAVILTPGTTDPFAPKVVRSGMGAHFRLAILQMTWTEIHERFLQPGENNRLAVYLAEAGDGPAPWELDLRQPTALVIGGEADGAGPEARTLVDGLITIPMPGKFESLNAAAAASILIFEVVRQRTASALG
jgi:TrmH family RNA methyltransferase